MFEFLLPEHVKQSRPGYTPPTVILNAFPSDETLCVFSHMKTYIDCTSTLRGKETKLFISYIKPHHRVSRDTISRWIRETTTNAGVDTSMFKPHSTRSATASKAKVTSVPIQDVLGRAGWPLQEPLISFTISLYIVKIVLLQQYCTPEYQNYDSS